MEYAGFKFKYYSGEDVNPFLKKKDNSAQWWDGEKLFYDNLTARDGDEFAGRITKLYRVALAAKKVSGRLADTSLTEKERVLIFYLDLWNGKWTGEYDTIHTY
ncbi:MAG: hypothetical protein J5382_04630 [Bacteroidales bacterium]|nr:hypothetical protein [Bacteroidales bacterium]